MLNAIKKVSEEFLKISENKRIRIISKLDCDGITSSAILTKTFQRLDKQFTLKTIENFTEEIIVNELKNKQNEILIFINLKKENLAYFQNLNKPVFILGHQNINPGNLNKNIKIINPYLTGNNETNNCTSAGICYIFSKSISEKNKDLSSIAIIGMVGEKQGEDLSKINQLILNDTSNLEIKKGLVLYPATRPLKKTLEYSTSPYIPGVTGNSNGTLALLRETRIDPKKNLLELSSEEMSRLITSIMIRQAKDNTIENIVGNLYILRFFNTREDVREISVLINTCSRLGNSDTAIAYCLGNKKAKARALEIYTTYKQELVSGLRLAENIEKINGKGFVIFNARDKIKDVVIGTICSMISSSATYEEGTILIGMAYNKNKIKISARIVGKKGRNLKDILEKTITSFKNNYPETGAMARGHQFAAGCFIERGNEEQFIKELKKTLEIEIIKI
jgi:RecJ-like exonuclease